MDKEKILKEIHSMLDLMGFEEDVESIQAHEGATSRFSIYLKHTPMHIPHEYQEGTNEHAKSPVSNMLIGERGSTLAALEYVLKRIIKKKYGEDQRFTLDINDYRIRRLEDLKQDIKTAAKEVRLHKREVPLREMSSFERRIVHLLLAEYPDITTESIGQEPNRKVVIKPYP